MNVRFRLGFINPRMLSLVTLVSQVRHRCFQVIRSALSGCFWFLAWCGPVRFGLVRATTNHPINNLWTPANIAKCSLLSEPTNVDVIISRDDESAALSVHRAMLRYITPPQSQTTPPTCSRISIPMVPAPATISTSSYPLMYRMPCKKRSDSRY